MTPLTVAEGQAAELDDVSSGGTASGGRIRYGQPDAASNLMRCGRKVALRTPIAGAPIARIRMTDGTFRLMTWVLDGEPVSLPQLEYIAAKAMSARRAESILASTRKGR